MQRSVDRVAALFAPAVLGIAALTALGCALAGQTPLDTALRAASVLIVACPCALGLATPAVVSAALGRAAELGLWFKSGAALERAGRVDRVLLDKTGTLTEGRLEVTRILCAPGVDANEVLAAAAATLGAAPHPIAAGVRREAERRGTRFARARAAGAAGPRRRGGRAAVRLARAPRGARGRARSRRSTAAALEAASQGASLAFVAEAGRARGALAFADALRGDARAALARLAAKGVTVALVSGDHAAAARRAAEQAGIAEVASGASPEEKVARVRAERAARRARRLRGRRAQRRGRAGRGGARLRLRAGLGRDPARGRRREPRAGPAALPRALELGRAATRRIHENLALAILYNAVAVPLAIAGVLGPFGAALAMSASSLVVTGNALRMLRFGRTA